jgi:hypothetical protein
MYNGVNLISADGYRVGVLRVLDTLPRQLTVNQNRPCTPPGSQGATALPSRYDRSMRLERPLPYPALNK